MFGAKVSHIAQAFRGVTPRRLANAARVWQSYRQSLRSGQAVLRGMPMSLAIEPTTSCNLRCPQCISGRRDFSRPTGMMDMALFRHIVDQVHQDLLGLTLYFQGEPMLHHAFTEMCAYAHQKGIYTFSSTNAHYITAETAEALVLSGLNTLVVSLDGLTQESYATYRVGGQLSKVLEGITFLSSAKKKLKRHHPRIVVQFIAFRHNEHEIPALRQWFKNAGADVLHIKTAQVYHNWEGEAWLPENQSLSRYKKDETGTLKLNRKETNECWRMWHSAVVTWDGQVVPCCFDKDAQHSMGSLQKQTFQQVWQGEAYQTFRQNILIRRSTYDMCTNCTEGAKMWADV